MGILRLGETVNDDDHGTRNGDCKMEQRKKGRRRIIIAKLWFMC